MSTLTVFNSPSSCMSSREIAELTGKRHDNVMRDIREMLSNLGISESMHLGSFIEPQNGCVYPMFTLPKREALILLTGYKYLAGTADFDKVLEHFGEVPASPKFIRKEFSFGEDIVLKLFAGYTVIPQFSVSNGKYLLDWYVPELKLAIEFDDRYHDLAHQSKKDAERQEEIEALLGCRFLRYKV